MKTLITVVVILVVIAGLFALKYYGYAPASLNLKSGNCTYIKQTSSEQEGVPSSFVATGKYVKGKCV